MIKVTENWYTARKLWQKLFNFYKENGGPLDNLDNLIIDMENCKKFLSENQTEAVFCFTHQDTYWYVGSVDDRYMEYNSKDFAVSITRKDGEIHLKQLKTWFTVEKLEL